MKSLEAVPGSGKGVSVRPKGKAGRVESWEENLHDTSRLFGFSLQKPFEAGNKVLHIRKRSEEKISVGSPLVDCPRFIFVDNDANQNDYLLLTSHDNARLSRDLISERCG